MNFLTVILSIILSFLSVGDAGTITSSSQNTIDVSSSRNQDICITAAVGITFTGENGNNYVSFRTTSSENRNNTSTKTQLKLIKAGKVIDTNRINRHVIYSTSLPGDDLAGRYLYAICCLRI